MTDGTLAGLPLAPDQLARAAALGVARECLTARGPLRSDAVEPKDLYHLAVYIITGQDPWEQVELVEPDDDGGDGAPPWEQMPADPDPGDFTHG